MPLAALLFSLLLIAFARAAVHFETHWFLQRVDHFSSRLPPSNNLTWSQRYLLNSSFFSNDDSGAIFFYTGNEGDVTLYAEHTGLMWENAAAAHALVIFGEHRYYGASWPLQTSNASLLHMEYLSSQQALADYANLLRHVREELGVLPTIPVVCFGGSYGGVLSAMFRAAYPQAVDGAIASSAPLRAFLGQAPPWNSNLYYQVITRDATAEGGSPDACAANMRRLWPALFLDAKSAPGRARLSAAFATCAPLETEDDALALAFFIRGTWDELAMGNWPYASSYLTGGGDVFLPAFPLRKACSYLGSGELPIGELYGAVFAAISVLNNASAVPCFDIPPNPYSHPQLPYDGIWDYQQCTEMQPDSQWFTSNGVEDMFFASPYNTTFLAEHCRLAWGVEPDWGWMATRYALPDFHGASNILFVNGLQDPWSGPGIQLSPNPARDLIVLNVSEGAHHLDLFFTNPQDPPSVTEVRRVEVAYITKWLADARVARRGAGGDL